MGQTPALVLQLLAVAGALVVNYLTASGWEGNIAQIASVLVINLGTLAFWGIMSLLKKFGVKLEIITTIIQAVEEQATGKTGDQKLELAMSMLDAEVDKSNLGMIPKLFFKPFAKFMISAAAKPLKNLLYATPPNKG